MVIVGISVDWILKRNMYHEPKNELWDFCPSIIEGESLLSWFTRLVKANCSDVRLIYCMLTYPSSLHQITLHSLGESMKEIESDSIKRMQLLKMLQPFLSISLKELNSNPFKTILSKDQWDYLNTPLDSPRYCPICLGQDEIPYYRSEWFTKPYVV